MRKAVLMAVVVSAGTFSSLIGEAQAFHGWFRGCGGCYTGCAPCYTACTPCYRPCWRPLACWHLLCSRLCCSPCAGGYGACGYGGCGADYGCYGAYGNGCGAYGSCDASNGSCSDCYGSGSTSSGEWITSGDNYGAAGTESNPTVIYDGPAADRPKIEESRPVESPVTASRIAYRSGKVARGNGLDAFERGLQMKRQGTLAEAETYFEAAAAAEPQNALYQYHRALVIFDRSGAEVAQAALEQAVELERQNPIANWGKSMERIQGQGRLWIENARHAAGLVR